MRAGKSHLINGLLRIGGDRPRTVVVEATSVCVYSMQLAANESINAFADGENVVVTRAMMRFARDDLEPRSC